MVAEAEEKYTEKDCTLEDWTMLQEAILNAKVAANKDKTDQKEIEEAYYALKSTLSIVEKSEGSAGEDRFDIATEYYTPSAGSEQAENRNEGPVKFAIDGDPTTYWHTDKTINAVESGDAWFNIHFEEAQTVDGIRYMPRSGSAKANGKITAADIQISKDNGQTYETVLADVKFSTDAKWQKVSFDAIEGVTDVKIVAKETVATSASAANKYASAAEFRVTHPVQSVVEVDKTELEAAVDEAEVLDKDTYTGSSWEALQEKLTEAQNVLENKDATVYDVALALANLKDAVSGLTERAKIDVDALQKAIELAKEASTEGVLDSVIEKFNTALANAEDILAKVKAGDETITQEMVDNSCNELTTIMKDLELKKGDKTELEELIKKAESVDLSAYSAQMQEKVKKAIEAAKAVYADADAIQAEVDEAAANLKAALKEADAENEKEEDKKPSKDENAGGKNDTTGQNSQNSQNSQGSVKTGDTANTSTLIGMMMAALAAMAATVTFKKRRREDD